MTSLLPVLALANPIVAVVAIALVVLFFWGLFKRLLKVAIFFGIAAAIAWFVFFAG